MVNAVTTDARFCLLVYCCCWNSRLAASSSGRPLGLFCCSLELPKYQLGIININCTDVKEVIQSIHVDASCWFRMSLPFLQTALDSAIWFRINSLLVTFTFYNCIVPVRFLPWEIRDVFHHHPTIPPPGKSQLRQSRAIQPTVRIGCFSVSIIQ